MLSFLFRSSGDGDDDLGMRKSPREDLRDASSHARSDFQISLLLKSPNATAAAPVEMVPKKKKPWCDNTILNNPATSCG